MVTCSKAEWVECFARRRSVRPLFHGHITRAVAIFDDVGGVIRNHVHDQLHVECLSAGSERREVLLRSQMRVGFGQIHKPITVITGTGALDRPVHHRRCHPHTAESQIRYACHTVIAGLARSREAGEITAVKVSGRRGVETALTPPWSAAFVVGRVAIAVAVGHHEIDRLTY